MKSVWLICVATLASSFAWAAPSPGTTSHAPTLITVTGGDSDVVSPLYPARVWDAGVGGKVTLDCDLDAQGFATRCTLLGESPRGEGFGAAAGKLLSRSDMRVPTPAGQALPGNLNFAIAFSASAKGAAAGSKVIDQSQLTETLTPTQPQAVPTGGMTPKAITIRAGAPTDPSPFYPVGAVFDRTSGKASLTCDVAADHRATNCVVVSEAPARQDFGAAALKVAAAADFRAPTPANLPLPGKVTFAVSFEASR